MPNHYSAHDLRQRADLAAKMARLAAEFKAPAAPAPRRTPAQALFTALSTGDAATAEELFSAGHALDLHLGASEVLFERIFANDAGACLQAMIRHEAFSDAGEPDWQLGATLDCLAHDAAACLGPLLAMPQSVGLFRPEGLLALARRRSARRCEALLEGLAIGAAASEGSPGTAPRI